MLRSALVKPATHSGSHTEINSLQPFKSTPADTATKEYDHSLTEKQGVSIPDDTIVIRFQDSIFFPNANRAKKTSTAAIKLVYDKISNNKHIDRERSWSVASERQIEKLRKQFNVVLKDSPLSLVVYDLTSVAFVDVTAILALRELKHDLRQHCGKEVQFRMIGMSESVRDKFLRAKWRLCDDPERLEEDADLVCPSLEEATFYRRRSSLEGVTVCSETG